MKPFRKPFVMALLLLLLSGVQTPPHELTTSGQELSAETSHDVNGQGWGRFFAALGCMGCGFGALTLAASGWGAVLAATLNPNSIVVVGACIGTCGFALGIDELL